MKSETSWSGMIQRSVLLMLAPLVASSCSDDPGKPIPPVAHVATENQPDSVSHASAQEPPKKVVSTAATSGGNPAYEIIPPKISLGLVLPESTVLASFEVKNIGDRPFKIEYLTNECHCMALDYDRGTIAPGASAKVNASIKTSSSGARDTAAVVHLSDAARSKVRVPFHYGVVPEILFEPKLIDFGRVETGKVGEQTIRLKLNLPDEMKDPPALAPFVTHSLPIELSIDSVEVTPSRHGSCYWMATLHAKLHSDKPVPAFQTSVIFQPQDPKQFQPAMVMVKGEIVPAWYFERGAIGFGTVDVGQEATKEVRFFWPGEKPPDVFKLESDLPDLVISHVVDVERKCFVLTLVIKPSQPGKVEGTVSLTTSLATEPATLKVTARVN